MDRFIYRREHQASDLQRLDLPNRSEMLGVKLAAAEARLIELKTLLDETQAQRKRWDGHHESRSASDYADEELKRAV